MYRLNDAYDRSEHVSRTDDVKIAFLDTQIIIIPDHRTLMYSLAESAFRQI
jgi:hypothetical protein